MDMAPIQQIFKRMTILTLVLGVLIGLLVAILALMLIHLGTQDHGTSPLGAPLVTDQLLPLFFWVLFGGTSLLQWRRELLSKQLAASQPTASGASVPLRVHLYFAYGLMGFGLAGVQLVGLVLSLDLYHANGLYIIFFGFLGSWLLAWYLQYREHHRAA